MSSASTGAPRFNYIVTIHDQEALIESVLLSILACAGRNSRMFLVLDGCTDGTDAVIDRLEERWDHLPFTRIRTPDVHEILAIRAALERIPLDEEAYNVIVQDDVLLGDFRFEDRIAALHEHVREPIGLLTFRHGVNLVVDDREKCLRETDLVESCYGHGICDQPLLPGGVLKRMASIRSPGCVSTRVLREVGFPDERLAPCTWDDHDYSLRCLQAGYVNLVFALKFHSDVGWGGMRRGQAPGVAEAMERNPHYLYEKHRDFLRELDPAPFRLPPQYPELPLPGEGAETGRAQYEAARAQLQAWFVAPRRPLYRRAASLVKRKVAAAWRGARK